MKNILWLIISFPLFVFSQIRHDYFITAMPAGQFLIEKHKKTPHEGFDLTYGSAYRAALIQFGMNIKSKKYLIIGLNINERSGNYSAFSGGLGGGKNSSGNFKTTRAELQLLWLMNFQKCYFAGFAMGLYGGTVLQATGSATTSTWSLAGNNQQNEIIGDGKNVSTNEVGIIYQLNFNAPIIRQKHSISFQIYCKIGTGDVGLGSRGFGMGIGYTYLNKPKSEELLQSKNNEHY